MARRRASVSALGSPGRLAMRQGMAYAVALSLAGFSARDAAAQQQPAEGTIPPKTASSDYSAAGRDRAKSARR